MDAIDKEFREDIKFKEETKKAQLKVFIQIQLLCAALGTAVLIFVWASIWMMDHHPEVYQAPGLFLSTMGLSSIFVTCCLFFIISRFKVK